MCFLPFRDCLGIPSLPQAPDNKAPPSCCVRQSWATRRQKAKWWRSEMGDVLPFSILFPYISYIILSITYYICLYLCIYNVVCVHKLKNPIPLAVWKGLCMRIDFEDILSWMANQCHGIPIWKIGNHVAMFQTWRPTMYVYIYIYVCVSMHVCMSDTSTCVLFWTQ